MKKIENGMLFPIEVAQNEFDKVTLSQKSNIKEIDKIVVDSAYLEELIEALQSFIEE